MGDILMKFNINGGTSELPEPLFWGLSERGAGFSIRDYRPPRSYYIFKYTLSGRGAVTGAGKTQPLPPGTALFLKFPHPECYFHYPKGGAEPWRGVYIEFDAGSLEPVINRMLTDSGVVYEIPPESDIVRKLLDFQKGRRSGDIINMSAFEGAGLVFSVLASLRETRGGAGAYHSGLMNDICSYISENIGGPLTVQMIARRFSLSRGHLCLLFRERMRVSPLSYINAVRVRRACHLLEEGTLSNAEIAERTGSGSDVQFYHLFKRISGMTPGEFRASDRKLEIIKSI